MSGIVGNNTNRGSGIVKAAVVGADAIDGSNIADDAIDSEHYTAASIDTAAIATNQIDETLMKDAFVGDFTDATVTASDYFLHGDATDSGNTKKDTVQGILDLAGGGAWTYISTVTAAGASTVSFSGLATSTYDVFACFFSNVYPSADNDLLLRMEEAGGPSVDSGSNYYGFTSGGNNNASTLVGLGQSGGTSWKLTATTVDGASTGTTDGVIYFSQMQKTSKRPAVWGTMKYTGNGTEMGVMTFGGSNAGADSDGYSGFQFLPGGGTFTGTFRLYGLAKS